MADSNHEQNLRDAISAAEVAGDLAKADRLHKLFRSEVGADPQMMARHGRTVFQMGDKARAATITRRALRALPDNADIAAQLADIYFDQGRMQEAEAGYRAALAIDPDHVLSLRRLAQIIQLHENGRSEARDLLEKVIELAPEDIAGWLQLGAVYSSEEADMQNAEAAFQRVLDIAPNTPSAVHNFGLLRRFQGDLEMAESYLRRACELAPDHGDFAFSLGTCLLFKEEVEEALTWFNRASSLNPGHNAAHVYAAYCMLLLGRMEEGWRQYEQRLKLDVLRDVNYQRPRWDGGPLEGQTLLILCEQGMGDNLQFIRYAELAAERDCRVIVATHRSLIRLFKSLKGVALVTDSMPEPRHFHRYTPVMSLPLAFGTTAETIPSSVPYLRAPDELIAKWQKRLAHYEGFRVGLCWRGNPKHTNDRFRSSSLAEMAQLLDIPGAVFFSLHKMRDKNELTLPEGLVDIGTEFSDFADTAAAAENLDLIISVDTSVCHLAGAIGRPTWTMIPRGPDFRWGLKSDATPWYPTMTLFRQATLGDWSGVYKRMREKLTALAAKH